MDDLHRGRSRDRQQRRQLAAFDNWQLNQPGTMWPRYQGHDRVEQRSDSRDRRGRYHPRSGLDYGLQSIFPDYDGDFLDRELMDRYDPTYMAHIRRGRSVSSTGRRHIPVPRTFGRTKDRQFTYFGDIFEDRYQRDRARSPLPHFHGGRRLTCGNNGRHGWPRNLSPRGHLSGRGNRISCTEDHHTKPRGCRIGKSLPRWPELKRDREPERATSHSSDIARPTNRGRSTSHSHRSPRSTSLDGPRPNKPYSRSNTPSPPATPSRDPIETNTIVTTWGPYETQHLVETSPFYTLITIPPHPLDPHHQDSTPAITLHAVHPIPRRYLRLLGRTSQGIDALRFVGEFLDEKMFGVSELDEEWGLLEESLSRVNELLEGEGEQIVGRWGERAKSGMGRCGEKIKLVGEY